MIDIEKFNRILVSYKKDFLSKVWKNEHFKWEAINHFQNNWNLDSDNFATMLKKSLDKCGILLFSMHNFSAGMIVNFAKLAQKETKAMFMNLYDESIPLAKRIASFHNNSEKLRKEFDDGTWIEDYQSTNAISIYLWLRYPDKYYIFKNPVFTKVAKKLGVEFEIEDASKPNTLIEGFKLYNSIHELIVKDKELKTLLNSVLTPECYRDDNLITMTTDFAYYIYAMYNSVESVNESNNITMEMWYELLNDPFIFNESSLKIMKRIKDFGDEVSGYELSVKYGESEIYYISESESLATHIAEKLNLDINTQSDNIQEMLAIMYNEVENTDNKSKSYIFKLRANLSKAIDKMDLSKVNLFENMNPSIWKINQSSTDFSEQELSDNAYKSRVIIDSTLKAVGPTRLTQSDAFSLKVKKGDYFYLTNDDKIKLIGQFSSNQATKSLKNSANWIQRSYIEIANSKDMKAYSSIKKWWTPNINSKFIKVPESDVALFQDLILKPYFDLDLETLFTNDIKNQSFWWLNVNPLYWSFDDKKKGEEQKISLYNDNGNPRKIFQNFLDAKINDFIICYESSPSKQIVAIAQITQKVDDKFLYFKKIEGLSKPIDYSTLKNSTQLKNMEYFTKPLGSFFKLTKEEGESILDIIRESNPLERNNGIMLYGKEDFLREVYMDASRLDLLIALLKHKMNIILQGAAGVGKTFASKRLAYVLIGKKDDSHIELIQFHQNYSYEDFILNFRVQDEERELKKGIFYRFCLKALNNPNEPYFFIIDEINRGNMRKIFGEVCMLMEKDYRGTKATLAYSGMPFTVPKNLYIIGMMNTADRSIAKIDYTLRRRFSFFEMYPGFDSKDFKLYQNKFKNHKFDTLIENIKDLNIEIENDVNLGQGFCIGHSYFTSQEKITEEWMKEVIEFDIIPLINEYWFDDKEKLNNWENRLRNAII
ncbi:MAG: AAA family ATPase [Spirochaetaceae bacterium]|nr:AAA family ATPase [Spirochaetaceae bacterium]